MQKNANNLSIYSNNNNNNNNESVSTITNVKMKQPQGEKIQLLKNQIEKQMKAYVKQEEYEEMLKLIKVINVVTLSKDCQNRGIFHQNNLK